MARPIAEAVMATAAFLSSSFLLISGGSVVPTVFGSHVLGGLAALVSGVSLCVSLYQWDSHFGIFQAEMHASNARGIGPRMASLIVSISGILVLSGTAVMLYGIMA